MPFCRFVIAAALFAVAVPLASAAHAQEVPVTPPGGPATPTGTPDDGTTKKKKRFSFGPEVGAYIPTSGKTRDAFGDTWYNYGIGFGAVQSADAKGKFQFDLNLLGGNRNGNRSYLAPIGASYRRALSTSKSSSPYVGASLDVVPTYLKAPSYGVHSRLRFTGGGSVFAGFTFSESAYLQARYYAVGKSAGFDLSGLSLGAGFRF